jgi:selenocysteine-specific elongation factor
MEDGDAVDLFRQNLREAGLAGLALTDAMGFEDDEAAVRAGKRLYDRGLADALRTRLHELVTAYAARFPLRVGMPKEEARRRVKFKGGAAEWNALVQVLAEPAVWVVAGDRIALRPGGPELTAGQREAVEKVAAELAARGLDWPGLDALAGAAGDLDPAEVVRHLLDHGRLTAINTEYVVATGALGDLFDRLRAHFASADELTFGEFRELSGLSRKLGIPLLEHLDQKGVTARDGDVRRAGPALDEATT